MDKWGMCENATAHTRFLPIPVIHWMELGGGGGGKPKWPPLKFAYHDVIKCVQGQFCGFLARVSECCSNGFILNHFSLRDYYGLYRTTLTLYVVRCERFDEWLDVCEGREKSKYSICSKTTDDRSRKEHWSLKVWVQKSHRRSKISSDYVISSPSLVRTDTPSARKYLHRITLPTEFWEHKRRIKHRREGKSLKENVSSQQSLQHVQYSWEERCSGELF